MCPEFQPIRKGCSTTVYLRWRQPDRGDKEVVNVEPINHSPRGRVD